MTDIKRTITRPLLIVGLLAAAMTVPMVRGEEASSNSHWSFQPVQRPSVPTPRPVAGRDWTRNAVDRFILSQMQRRALAPAPEASRYTLIRRATLDLTGLPPTPQQIVAFIKDDSPDAYEKLIERLLASPHYGERWGRHWLDVARYVPGSIKVLGVDRPDMATDYVDYVVRAFNSDMPYDRFVTEQLAGDLLPVPDNVATNDDARQRYFGQVFAPAFLSIGPWFHE